MTTLAACAAAPPAPPVVARTLPSLPEWVRPVADPRPPRVGESAYLIREREKAAREDANRRLVNVGDWYAGVKRSYENPGAD